MCIKQFNLPFIQKPMENQKKHTYLRDASSERASKSAANDGVSAVENIKDGFTELSLHKYSGKSVVKWLVTKNKLMADKIDLKIKIFTF